VNSLAATEVELARLENERQKVLAKQLRIIRGSFIKCAKCGENSKLFSWTFIQDMFYVEPYSCTGGDYWLNSETRCCHIVCPKCEGEIYLYNDPQRDKIVNLIKANPFGKDKLFHEVKKRQKD